MFIHNDFVFDFRQTKSIWVAVNLLWLLQSVDVTIVFVVVAGAVAAIATVIATTATLMPSPPMISAAGVAFHDGGDVECIYGAQCTMGWELLSAVSLMMPHRCKCVGCSALKVAVAAIVVAAAIPIPQQHWHRCRSAAADEAIRAASTAVPENCPHSWWRQLQIRIEGKQQQPRTPWQGSILTTIGMPSRNIPSTAWLIQAVEFSSPHFQHNCRFHWVVALCQWSRRFSCCSFQSMH